MSEDINPELIEKAASAVLHERAYIVATFGVPLDSVGECAGIIARAVLSAVTDDLRSEGAALSLPDVVRQAKAEAWDEGHYMSELTLRHVYDGHDCEEGEMCPTCCQPNPYRSERIESLGENPVLTAMTEYGEAIRGDWSNFDFSAPIDGWVQELRQPDPSHDIEWHRRDLGICMAGGGHWCGYWGHCDDECGCEPCAEERSAR